MDRLLRHLLSEFIRRGSISFTTSRGARFTCGDGTGIPVIARFLTRGAEIRILLHPELALGEAFMDGTFVIEQGSIADALAILLDQPGILPSWAKHQWWARYFVRRRCAELLTEDGVMVLHSIGRSQGPDATNPWITKYIFPGGYVPALSEVLPAIERAGLFVCDVEILRLHYAETLKAWRERFLARREEAVRLYDERFARMWEFYLAASEMSFRKQGLMNFQIQLARHQGVTPMTRDYIFHAEVKLRASENRRRPRLAAAGP